MAGNTTDDGGSPWLNLLLIIAMVYIIPYIPWRKLWTTNTLVPGFHKKTVIVTSLRGTLGLPLVMRLGELGVKVILGYHTQGEVMLLNEMKKHFKAKMLPLDLLDENNFKEMMDFVEESTEEGDANGGLWGVVNNSTNPVTPLPDNSPYSGYPPIVFGATHMMTHFLPALRKTSGRLVTVSGVGGGVTEETTLAVFKSLRTQAENRGIRISTVRLDSFLGSTVQQSDDDAAVDCVLNALFALHSYEDYVIKAGFVRQIKNTIRGFLRFGR